MSAAVTAIHSNGAEKEPRTQASATAPVVGEDVIRLVTDGLRDNTRLNLAVRIVLSLFGVACCVLALRYVVLRGDQMVQILRQKGDPGDLIGKRLFVLCMPVLLFGVLAGLAGAAAWTMHVRGQEETTRTLDTLSRLKREGEVAASARGLMYAFEEKLQNARRAFSLLLWLGRAVFVICIGLFTAAVINAMANGADLLTAALGASSVAGSVFAVANGVPRKVKAHMADVIQVQTIVTGCDRQISLLESDALAALNNPDFAVGDTHKVVLEVQERIGGVVANAAEQIENYVDPCNADEVVSLDGASA
jgi:hypothetical protein